MGKSTSLVVKQLFHSAVPSILVKICEKCNLIGQLTTIDHNTQSKGQILNKTSRITKILNNTSRITKILNNTSRITKILNTSRITKILNNVTSRQARSIFVLKHTTSYRASEILLGVVNAKSGICYIYVCVWMVRMPLALGELFSLKNSAF